MCAPQAGQTQESSCHRWPEATQVTLRAAAAQVLQAPGVPRLKPRVIHAACVGPLPWSFCGQPLAPFFLNHPTVYAQSASVTSDVPFIVLMKTAEKHSACSSDLRDSSSLLALPATVRAAQ